MRSPLNNRSRRILAVLVVAMLGAGSAWAYWVSPSAGSAGGKVGSLGLPTIKSATPGTGTVTLSWSAVTAPGAGSVTYYVKRDGGAPSGECPSSSAPSTATGCTDSGLSPGAHKYTVTAIYRSWTSRSAEASATVTVGAADHLVLGAASTSPTAGTSDNLTITAKDSAGTTVTSYTGAKSLTFSGASAIGSNQPTVTNSSGTAVAFGTAETITFTNGLATVSSGRNGAMTLYKAETAGVTVSDGTISSGSGTAIAVSPAGASTLAAATPSSPVAGQAFNETLTANDQYGNLATSYTGTKTLSFKNPANSPSGEAPHYPGTVSFTAGVGTGSVTLYDAQTTSLTVKEGFSGPSGTSAGFAVAPGSASSFTLAAPGNQVAGTPFNEALTANDKWGNTATSYEGTKTVAFSEPHTSPSGKAPVYPESVTFTAGKGSAAAIVLYDAESTTLKATEGSVSGTSTGFTVAAAGTPASYTLSTPSAPSAGSAFTETVTAKDAYGNTAAYTAQPSVSFSGPSAAPGGQAPVYPASVNFTSGTGTATVKLYAAQSTTLTVTINGLSASTSSFTVAGGTASALGFAPVATQTAGYAFEVTLTAQDQYGNLARYEGPKTLTWTGAESSPNGTAPVYKSSVTFANGSATAPVTLYKATNTTLKVTQGTLNGSSSSFAVNAAAASALSLPSAVERTAGSAFSETLTAIDAFGNTATGYTGTKTIAFSGPAGSPSGKAPVYPTSVSFTAGTGTATGITLYKAAATTLTASDGTYSGSAGFTVAPAGASTFSLSTPAPVAGTAFTETITAIDSYGNTATGYTGGHTLSFSGPASSPNGTAPVYPTGGSVTFTSGVGMPSVKLYNAAATTLTATATQGSVTGSSASFGVTPAAAATIVFGSIGAQTAGSAVSVGLTIKDAYGNGLEGATPVTFRGASESPSEKAPSYPSSVTLSAGAGTASVTLYDAAATTLTGEAGNAKGTSASFAVNPSSATALAWTSPSSFSGSQESALCLFTCTWRELGRSHQWTAKVSVTDAWGNIVSNIGTGHTVSWTPAPAGSISPAGLTLPSSGAATTATATYTSQGSNSWTSDTLTAHAAGFSDATATLKK